MKNLNNNKYAKEKIPISSEKSDIIKGLKRKNEIPILELLKCPICQNICLMNINKDKLLFSFECTNSHKNNKINNKFKKCRTNANESYYSFPSDFSDLNLSKEYNINLNKVNNKDNNTSKISNTTLQKLYITEKDFTCAIHPNLKYDSYCFECKKNLCDECKKEHMNHNQINLSSIKPNDKEVILCKKNIKKSEVILWNLIEYIQTWKFEFDKGLNTLIKIMENIFNLKEFIINNYDQKQNNQNYNYIQNFNNIKQIDFIFPELKNFSEKKDFKETGYDIIDLINNIRKKISENKIKINANKDFQLNKLKNNPKNNNKIFDINNKENTGNSPLLKNNNFNTTFSSDCNNNNYFARNVSTSSVPPKSKQNEKKIITRNKINKIVEDHNISKTIEQNNDLEKCTDFEDKAKITENENNIDNEIIIKSIEVAKNKIQENINNNNFEIDQNEDYIKKDNQNIDFNMNNKYNSNQNITGSLNTLKENYEQNNLTNDKNLEINNNYELYQNNEKNHIAIRNKYIYSGIELKCELTNTDIIRSIEILSPEYVLISTLENIVVYKIDSNDELVKVYDIKEFNYRINYATKLSDGNLIICSFNNIDIIKLNDNDLGSYDIIQKLEVKNNSENINKIKEIKDQNYLISCDKNNIILYEKNKETNLYSEKKYIKTNTEVKCLEQIRQNLIITVEPEIQKIIFYDIDSLEKAHEINNINSSFGRYVICYIEKYDFIFITGRLGIYLISAKDFDIKIFFKVNEWVSSINYDIESNCLICGTWQKDSLYEKNYNLILYEIVQKNQDNNIENIKIRELTRKNNAHSNDIIVIQPFYENRIITGSNDNTVKLWK